MAREKSVFFATATSFSTSSSKDVFSIWTDMESISAWWSREAQLSVLFLLVSCKSKVIGSVDACRRRIGARGQPTSLWQGQKSKAKPFVRKRGGEEEACQRQGETQGRRRDCGECQPWAAEVGRRELGERVVQGLLGDSVGSPRESVGGFFRKNGYLKG